MRKFGVEIEFAGSIDAALQALAAEGLVRRAVQHGYVGHDDAYWVVKRDGSVYDGGELVSPPLDFDDPDHREQVTRAVKALKTAGCRTTETAGIHVHIDTTGMGPADIAAVARVYTKFEDVLYRIASSGWQRMRGGARQYAKPLEDQQVTRLARAKTEDQLLRAYYGSADANARRRAQYHGDHARYYGLNLHSWFYRKTIEFRIFNSSLNPERIQGYIAICVALVQDARNGNRRSVNKAYRLGDMAAGRAKEDAALHRFLQVLRYEAGMSVEDMKRVRRIWKDSRPQVHFTRTTATV